MSFSHSTEIEASRKRLLDAIGRASDITFIRTYGNIGDELIFAGTRQLLTGIQYREASILNLDGVKGEVALVSGSGGWSRPYHDMPKYLPQIEDQFRQVVILPSSFDVSVAQVRRALERTKALVCAREEVSYAAIRSLCHAELAHDCAFFFDYGPYMHTGQGLLLAFRTDREAASGRLPEGNLDISSTCKSLDEWLWTIARYEEVRTDRAHVMIAAAMLGKRVRYRASQYHKVPAIAKYALHSFDVTSVTDDDERRDVKVDLMLFAAEQERLLPPDFFARHRKAEVTIVMLSYGRLAQTLNAVRAVCENVRISFRLLLIDNGSGLEAQEKLRQTAAGDERIEFLALNENIGCVGGRALATTQLSTEFVMWIDNDIEILPLAVEHLLHQFDLHPEATAVTGKVVFPDGSIHVCGADYWTRNGVLFFALLGRGRRFDAGEVATGPCGWVPGGMTLMRTAMIRDFPYDLEMRHYFEDTEWSYRVNQSGSGAFYRCAESVGIHFHRDKIPDRSLPTEEVRRQTMKFLIPLAHFYGKHGVIHAALFNVLPELGAPNNQRAISAGRILLTLLDGRESDSVLEMWNRGDLEPLMSQGNEQPPPFELARKAMSALGKVGRTLRRAGKKMAGAVGGSRT